MLWVFFGWFVCFGVFFVCFLFACFLVGDGIVGVGSILCAIFSLLSDMLEK